MSQSENLRYLSISQQVELFAFASMVRSLSITHILFGDEVAEVDVVGAGEAAPEDLVAGRRIAGAGAGEVAAKLGEFEEVMAEAGFVDNEGLWHTLQGAGF